MDQPLSPPILSFAPPASSRLTAALSSSRLTAVSPYASSGVHPPPAASKSQPHLSQPPATFRGLQPHSRFHLYSGHSGLEPRSRLSHTAFSTFLGFSFFEAECRPCTAVPVPPTGRWASALQRLFSPLELKLSLPLALLLPPPSFSSSASRSTWIIWFSGAVTWTMWFL